MDRVWLSIILVPARLASGGALEGDADVEARALGQRDQGLGAPAHCRRRCHATSMRSVLRRGSMAVAAHFRS